MVRRCPAILVALTCLANVLSGASGIANGMVLCLDDDGHVAVEGEHATGGCPASPHHGDPCGERHALPTSPPPSGCHDVSVGEQTVERPAAAKLVCPDVSSPAHACWQPPAPPAAFPPQSGSCGDASRHRLPGQAAHLRTVVLLN